MKQERVILSFIMVLIGLAFAGIIFYFYQSSKVIPDKNIAKTNTLTPTPTPVSNLFLTLDDPRDESIADKKTIRVAGKTNPEATVVILTLEGEEIVKPSLQGDFVTNITIDSGTNYIKVTAMTPDGESQTIQRLVSYTTEDF